MSNRGISKKTVGCGFILFLFALSALLLNIDRIGRYFFPVPYQDIVVQDARQNNLDPRLLEAIIKVESNFRTSARSSKGARGLMQIMPSTGQWIAQQLGVAPYNPESLDNPEINIKIGSWYVAELGNTFHGHLVLMLAAYNGGEGKVRKWFGDGVPAEGDSLLIERIPYPETRLFVQKVLLSYTMYQRLYNPDLTPKK